MTKINLEQKPAKTPPENGKTKATSSRQAGPQENMKMASIPKTKAQPSATGDASPSVKIVPAVKVAKEGAAGVWNENETVTGLWSTNEDKNSWMWINDNNNSANSGWKKISNASESGIVALTILANHAKQVGSKVSYRDEDDGMVHEMYVW